MDSRANYAVVGIFVLFLTVSIMIFAFWLGKYGFGEKYDYYKVYTTESVSGLSVDASVKYRGVDVGNVAKIAIDTKNPQKIEILLKVKKGTPILKGMEAELKYYGLTGLAYIELTGGDKNSTLLKHRDGEIPVLKTKPSFYNRLDKLVRDITSKISITLDRINKLLNEKNINNISKTIENTEKITEALRDSKEDIKDVIKNFLEIEKNVNALSNSLKIASKKISSSSDAFKNMSDSIKKLTKEQIDELIKKIDLTTKEADKLIEEIIKSIKNGDYNLKKISSSTIEQINEALIEMKKLMYIGEQTIEELKNSPSDIIYKKQKPTLGPGEKIE